MFYFIICALCVKLSKREYLQWWVLTDQSYFVLNQTNPYFYQLLLTDCWFEINGENKELNFQLKNYKHKLPQIINLCTMIETLNITNSGLKRIDMYFFVFRENLRHLNLSCNLLEIIPDEIFCLKFLKTLDLSKNKLTELPKMIGRLIELESLNLKGNKIIQISENLANLKNLIFLNLSENESLFESTDWYRTLLKHEELFKILNKSNLISIGLDNTGLYYIPKLYVSSTLELISLDNNHLIFLNENFKKFLSLKKINLGYNNFGSFPDVLFELPLLNYIGIENNNITGNIVLKKEYFKSLFQLNLGHNYIKKLIIPSDSLSQINYLYLHNNEITEIDNNFFNLRNLKYLDIRKNCINNISLKEITRDTSLEILIEVNRIEIIKELFLVKNLTYLSVVCKSASEKSEEINLFENLDVKNNLKTLLLESCFLTEIPRGLSKIHTIQNIFLRNNTISYFNAFFINLNDLITLDLSNNRLDTIDGNIFIHPSLRYLNLNNNMINCLPKEINYKKHHLIISLKNNNISLYGGTNCLGLFDISYKVIEKIEVDLHENYTFNYNAKEFYKYMFNNPFGWNLDKIKTIIPTKPKKHSLNGEFVLKIWEENIMKNIKENDTNTEITEYLKNLYGIESKMTYIVKHLDKEKKDTLKDFIEEIFLILYRNMNENSNMISSTILSLTPGIFECYDAQYEHLKRAYYAIKQKEDNFDIIFYINEMIGEIKNEVLSKITTSNELFQNVHILSYWRNELADELGFQKSNTIYGTLTNNTCLNCKEYILYHFFKEFDAYETVKKLHQKINSKGKFITLASKFIFNKIDDEKKIGIYLKYNNLDDMDFSEIKLSGVALILCCFNYTYIQ
ncbi:Leucine rich repeat protein [Spraguea lophii 42_110]|uniref:Leucine rich repeat protein n=1 Tax=Spraguea lophii (strain 42_110) TaxID=1358809 RepID=S7WCE7_SPRLO|nr:Leucine rich repeat protein [Spraguea lophii 42_110]